MTKIMVCQNKVSGYFALFQYWKKRLSGLREMPALSHRMMKKII